MMEGVQSAGCRRFVLVLVVVLVLENAWPVGEVSWAQRLEGSRFGASSHDLTIFALARNLTRECIQQAAPGNNPA